ncbi:MAG: hypothetical protein R2862_11690 [Thermoanaerobaculia bacterium]
MILAGILRRTKHALRRAGQPVGPPPGDKVRFVKTLASTGRSEVAATVERSPIVAVVRHRDPEEAARRARAFLRHGLEMIEVTFTVPDATSLVRTLLLGRRPGRRPGSGWSAVTTRERAAAAVAAGSEFFVTPNVSATSPKSPTPTISTSVWAP